MKKTDAQKAFLVNGCSEGILGQILCMKTSHLSSTIKGLQDSSIKDDGLYEELWYIHGAARLSTLSHLCPPSLYGCWRCFSAGRSPTLARRIQEQ